MPRLDAGARPPTPLFSSMRLNRALQLPRPSSGRILHQRGWHERRAWSDDRCPEARNAIPTSSWPADLRLLSRLMQFPRVVIPHGGAGISMRGGFLNVAERDASTQRSGDVG